MTTKKPASKKLRGAPQRKAAPKPKAAAKPKAAQKEPRVKHAPEPLPEPNRQAKGWRGAQPIYED